jgi:NADH dehydrogenase/NADH:ubiquinone oxidoreductase subunit G
MKLSAFVERLAKKAAVDTSLLALPASVTDVDIPDDIASGIDNALMTVDAAKNNPEIRKAIKIETLNGVDAKVAEVLEELGITSDASEILEEKNSFEKIAKLTRKVKELESKKAGANTKQDKDAVEQKLADLNKEIKAAKDALALKEKEWADTRNSDLTTFEIQKKLLGKEYSLPKEMNADLKVNTAQSAVNMALQAKGYKLIRTEQGGLQIVDKDGNKAFSDSHEELQVDSFIDGALAQNKLLKVNDQNPAGGGNNPVIVNDGAVKGNAAIVAEIDNGLFK